MIGKELAAPINPRAGSDAEIKRDERKHLEMMAAVIAAQLLKPESLSQFAASHEQLRTHCEDIALQALFTALSIRDTVKKMNAEPLTE